MTEAAQEIEECDTHFFQHRRQFCYPVSIAMAQQVLGIIGRDFRLAYLKSQGAELTLLYSCRNKLPGEWDAYPQFEIFNLFPCVVVIEACEGEFIRAPAPRIALEQYNLMIQQSIDVARGDHV